MFFNLGLKGSQINNKVYWQRKCLMKIQFRVWFIIYFLCIYRVRKQAQRLFNKVFFSNKRINFFGAGAGTNMKIVSYWSYNID